ARSTPQPIGGGSDGRERVVRVEARVDARASISGGVRRPHDPVDVREGTVAHPGLRERGLGMFQKSSGRILRVYRLIPMNPVAIGDGGWPLADSLRGRVERILAVFQAAPAQDASSVDRSAVERFLLALDELAAATDALSAPRAGQSGERAPGPILV